MCFHIYSNDHLSYRWLTEKRLTDNSLSAVIPTFFVAGSRGRENTIRMTLGAVLTIPARGRVCASRRFLDNAAPRHILRYRSPNAFLASKVA
jgi:cytochrome P450